MGFAELTVSAFFQATESSGFRLSIDFNTIPPIKPKPAQTRNGHGQYRSSNPCFMLTPKIVINVAMGKKKAASTFNRCAATAIF